VKLVFDQWYHLLAGIRHTEEYHGNVECVIHDIRNIYWAMECTLKG
jgi:hypothetical protein